MRFMYTSDTDLTNVYSLAAHTNIQSRYMQVGEATADGQTIVRRFGMAVRLKVTDDFRKKYAMKLEADVTTLPMLKRNILDRALRAASTLLGEGYPLFSVFRGLENAPNIRNDADLQRAIAVLERHVSWTYDMNTNARRFESPIPQVS